ncbi:MAG: PQQ-dependent sugar dehydrogenase [Cytophagales bacterium]|nr:PQQ-dependent sugar dehydrogenase [Cytophagales bacterium]
MNKIFYLLLFLSIALASCSENADDPSKKPEDNRFTEVELSRGLDEPMEMTFLPDNKILIVERKGGLKLVNENTKETTDAGFISVNTFYTNKEGKTRPAEEGLMGVIADHNFEENHWVYLYYAHPDTAKHVLARYEFKDDYLVEDSKKVILEVPTQREECCHTGGGMTWDPAGNLYLTVGNNTVNPRSGASNLNELPGHENEDDQRAPGNSNDLRGKILRITPQPDGTYTIPKGNLFPEGTDKTRPEIYTMGHRNPWRPTIDTKTGYLYWGEVGPDASKDSIWGPMGYDEYNQAKEPGFFGWPYFIGNNRPYNRYNSEYGTYGEPFDVNNVLNESVNNTGITKLGDPVPAFLYYPYGPSPEFPMMGTSGRSATGGPVFRKADFKNAPRPWPSYYEGKWLITEFMRGWIMAITMDENGDYVSMEKVLPEKNFSSAIDMDFGPSGDLYVLEYGTAWFKGNENARLVKLEYNSGNRKPEVAASADRYSGKLPLHVQFSSEGSMDYDYYDKDNLSFEWSIKKDDAPEVKMEGASPTYTFEEGGDYTVTLTVKDSKGESNATSFNITAGNEAPKVNIDLASGNKTFYFGEGPLDYNVEVNDAEDGKSGQGIRAEEVAVTFDYVPAGYDPIEMAANQASADEVASFSIGRTLIQGSDCISCHQFNEKSIGPSYEAVAARYPNNAKNREMLVDKIINGGSGVWGEHGMSAHPDLSKTDAARMVDYILNYGKSGGNSSLGLTGKVSLKKLDFEPEPGSFVLRAAYKDKGSDMAKSLMTEKLMVLKSPILSPHTAEFKRSTIIQTASRNSFYAVGDNSSIGYKNIDLTDISEIVPYVLTGGRAAVLGGYIELNLDSMDGPVVSRSESLGKSPDTGFRRPDATGLPLTIPEGVSGKHDVFFRFRNSDAGPDEFVFQIQRIEFKQ